MITAHEGCHVILALVARIILPSTSRQCVAQESTDTGRHLHINAAIQLAHTQADTAMNLTETQGHSGVPLHDGKGSPKIHRLPTVVIRANQLSSEKCLLIKMSDVIELHRAHPKP